MPYIASMNVYTYHMLGVGVGLGVGLGLGYRVRGPGHPRTFAGNPGHPSKDLVLLLVFQSIFRHIWD